MSERTYWVAWALIPGVGAVLLKRLQEYFSSLEQAWKAPVQDIGQIEGFGGKLLQTITQFRSQNTPEKLLEEHSQKNPHFWTPADEDYPILLKEIPSPPPILYYCGELNKQENQGITPMVGIVGTRQPSEHGRRWTKKISKALAAQGFTVVSGMAAGIDGEAHRACLEAGGRTIAVLGTGVDVVYPDNHHQLYNQIKNQGLILSEYPAGTTPFKGNFPPRNRIIAALSRAVLIMEAPEKSGSLITARYANDFGRDVYILPNTPDNPKSRGSLRLLQQGAGVIIEEDELLSNLGAIPKLDTPQQTVSNLNLSAELAKVLEAIAEDPKAFDTIVQEVGMSAGAVSAALLELELLGKVSQLPGMRYQKS